MYIAILLTGINHFVQSTLIKIKKLSNKNRKFPTWFTPSYPHSFLFNNNKANIAKIYILPLTKKIKAL